VYTPYILSNVWFWPILVRAALFVLRLCAKTPSGVLFLAGAIRTVQFMNRYSSEINGREDRMQELKVTP
jgi:hypothetical protein